MFVEDKSKFPQVDTAVDPFSADGLIAWLETKNPAAEYDWGCITGKCLFAQWGEDHGLGTLTIAYNAACSKMRAANSFGPILTAGVAIHRPHTFGAALTRARSIKAGT